MKEKILAYITIIANCRYCDTRGFVIDDGKFIDCTECNGFGVRRYDKLLSVPANIVRKGINLIKKVSTPEEIAKEICKICLHINENELSMTDAVELATKAVREYGEQQWIEGYRKKQYDDEMAQHAKNFGGINHGT